MTAAFEFVDALLAVGTICELPGLKGFISAVPIGLRDDLKLAL